MWHILFVHLCRIFCTHAEINSNYAHGCYYFDVTVVCLPRDDEFADNVATTVNEAIVKERSKSDDQKHLKLDTLVRFLSVCILSLDVHCTMFSELALLIFLVIFCLINVIFNIFTLCVDAVFFFKWQVIILGNNTLKG